MPHIGTEPLKLLEAGVAADRKAQTSIRKEWKELADMILPSRYKSLLTIQEINKVQGRNKAILDGTGTKAARTLAAGLLNGETSPARPWFKLRLPGFHYFKSSGMEKLPTLEQQKYLDEVETEMLTVFAESNLYNALGVMYLDLVVFGSASMLIYEDFKTVLRCYNPSLGTFFFRRSQREDVDVFTREFSMTVKQVIEKWPNEEYWSERIKQAVLTGGAALLTNIGITQLIEPNKKDKLNVPSRFPYREIYWETNRNNPKGTVLSMNGFYELPGVFPRWDVEDGSAYGNSPGMDAMGDIIQLQHQTKTKAVGLDKMVKPPVIMPIELKNQPTALMPNGVTYASNVGAATAKRLYDINLPLGDLSADIYQVQERIKETFYNQLFDSYNSGDKVQSAAYENNKRNERLVLLTTVLTRFNNEALDPLVRRAFNIMNRAKLLPEPPESLRGTKLEIEYTSILAVAQRAVGTIPTERLFQLVGEVGALYPAVLDVPNPVELVKSYAKDIGVRASGLNTDEAIAEIQAQREQQASSEQALAAGDSLSTSAANLAKADVGGGTNALEQLLNG